MIFLFLLLFLIASAEQIYAVLDGRVIPIYLENRYSFTNYEWARGNVYFKKGFDLPINGTVIINIIQDVHGKILFRKSTLRLENDLRLALDGSLTGSGTIDAQGNNIFFLNDWSFAPGEKFVFTSDVSLRGNNTNTITFAQADASAGMAFTNLVNVLNFLNINIGPFLQSNIFLRTFAPTGLQFNNCKIFLQKSPLALSSWEIGIQNIVEIIGSGNTTLSMPNRIFFQPYSSLIVRNGISLSITQLFSYDNSLSLILDNAKLIYNPPTSPRLFFIRSWAGGEDKGRLIIRGKSSLEVSSGKSIWFTDKSVLEIDSGAQLKIEPNSVFSIF